jgi:ankyrin repeat protein
MLEGDTPLIDAARRGIAADVEALLAGGADVDEPNENGWAALHIACEEGHTDVVTTLLAANAEVDHSLDGAFGMAAPLIFACQQGHTDIVKKLIDANAEVNCTLDDGATPLYVASQTGHIEIVTKLIAAKADVNTPMNDGCTPLYIACQEGYTETAARLLAANAEVDQACEDGATPLAIACHRGRLDCVQLLSSYGARRFFSLPAPHQTAERIATSEGHQQLVGWLVRSRHWTALHHLDVLTPERALALLRAGADIHAAAEGWTPLSLAQALAAVGRANEGTAAFLVLEAAKPWSRKTHKYFPEPARARAVELLRVGQWFKRLPSDFPIQFEVWEVFVMPHMVTRDYQPPPPAPPRRSARVAGRGA